ncbi:MAG: ribosomal L7Ae/L30e/S12e/Gadd45 family protein [Candidatus Cloacimonetes bacterium]|nr:ribosomal L7Ae/L30e/S12e/Gadd45 family protein [Candidatus Cloacimonadota bacterium]MBL7108614.1 ribosomal L7Ae/L30e/S12e/Gadd45 family protein [Candidatus Cloacimonadota bacterium]
MVEEKKEKIVNLFGLARKAKSIAFGKKAVKKSVFCKKTHLIFSGKSDNNFVKYISPICENEKIQISYLFSDEELEKIFGRRKLTVISIVDNNFTKGIKQILGK